MKVKYIVAAFFFFSVIAFGQNNNVKQFVLLENTQHTIEVPAGATSVTIEAWGGGGGGGANGGGQGGGYFKATVPVKAGLKLYFKVGAPGAVGNGLHGGNGGDSSFTCSTPGFNYYFVAQGGAGDDNTPRGKYENPTMVSATPLLNYQFVGAEGTSGTTSKVVGVAVVDTSRSLISSAGGDGGSPGAGTLTGGKGASFFGRVKLDSFGPVEKAFRDLPATPGASPGGGGGGVAFYSPTATGGKGGGGLVIVTVN